MSSTSSSSDEFARSIGPAFSFSSSLARSMTLWDIVGQLWARVRCVVGARAGWAFARCGGPNESARGPAIAALIDCCPASTVASASGRQRPQERSRVVSAAAKIVHPHVAKGLHTVQD